MKQVFEQFKLKMRNKSPTTGGGKGKKQMQTKTDDIVIDELEQKIRTNYQYYLDYVLRCQVEMKSQAQIQFGGNKPLKHLYFPPKVPFLEDPEKQRLYRKRYMAEISQGPEPESLILLGDVLQQRLQETIGDRSNPAMVKKDFASFFKRRLSQLYVKKAKMVSRWAFHSRMSVPDMERIGIVLDQALGRLQQEVDLSINRIERLTQEDNYGTAKSQRPIPGAKDEKDPSKLKPLYEEQDEFPSSSAIREDDIEVYLRIQTYRNKLFRQFDKFISELSWLPYFSRYEIWEQSRILMQDYKHETYDRLENLKKDLGENIRKKLEANGVIEERVVSAIIEKFTKQIKGPDGGSSINVPRMEYLMNSHKANHERTPVLTTSILELKASLKNLGQDFSVTGDLDLDNGYMFTYRVTALFPTHFQEQVLKLQFDLYDTSPEQDYLNLERMGKNIEALDRAEKERAVREMKSQQSLESKKSIIGRINAEELRAKDSQANRSLEGLQRENNVSSSFFSLEPSQYKLRKADWLQFVSIEGAVSETIKRQSHYFNSVEQYDSLLESAFNFLDVNEGSAVNRILEESAQTHVQRAQQRQMTKVENGATEDDEMEGFLKAALMKAGQVKLEEQLRQKLKELRDQVKVAEQPLHLSDPIPTHLVKSYYALRYLKTRDSKIRLLHYLNYFRSVQKRLSLDLKELLTKSKATLVPQEAEVIAPQFEKSAFLHQNRLMLDTSGGPGNIITTHAQRDLDTDNNKQDSNPLEGAKVDLKVIKYNKSFSPTTSSTCPCVPRYHVTFNRPRLYEEVSRELERGDLSTYSQIKRAEGQQDKWEVDEDSKEVTVYDEFGVKVIYQETLNDMLEIEEELIKIGTYYINQAEYLGDIDTREPASAIDRGEVALDLILQESDFQYQKMLLVHHYLEAYEHCTDPLELVRLAQLITDIMVQRPRLNAEGGYFVDCYRNEIEVLRQKRELIREVVSMQFDIEKQANEELRTFTELKYRKVNELLLAQNFQYSDGKERVHMLGIFEEEKQRRLAHLTSSLSSAGQGQQKELSIDEMLEHQKAQDEIKRQRIKEIAARHQSEFVDNKYTDFEELLGMSEIEKNQQSKQTSQMLDPQIMDCLRETAFFNKQVDGYAWYLERNPLSQLDLFGGSSHRIGTLDFYESICTLSKVEAGIQQTLEELIQTHRPEHGFAVATLERALILEARGRLKHVKTREPLITECTKIVEDDLYLGNADKLMFLMNEFKAHLSPELIKTHSNPILVGKLDPQDLQHFNFPRLRQKDLITERESLTHDQILVRMIDLAKLAVTEVASPEKPGGGAAGAKKDDIDKLFKFDLEDKEKQVKGPSKLRMSCNIVEVVRLREEVIQRIYETDILSCVYKKQLQMLGKGGTKLMLLDQINFDVSKVMGDSLNLIDINDGSAVDFDLPFREFDNTLKATIDFRSESCIKALMTDLGVEEIRAILHYQMMQQQLLHVAVSVNQTLMDGAQKALVELDLLARKKPFSAPNPIINLQALIQRTTEGNMGEAISKERSKYRQILTRDVGEACYLIDAKKGRLRQVYSSKFSTSLLRMSNSISTEIKLRLLRSQRIKLLHCYCKDVLREVYQDALKSQLLSVNNRLRVQTLVFAVHDNPFTYGLGMIQEPQLSFGFTQGNNLFDKDHRRSLQDPATLTSILNGDAVLYVPSSDEIMQLEPITRLPQESQTPGGDLIKEDANPEDVIKELVATPNINQRYFVDDGLIRPFRKVNLHEPQRYPSQSFKLLNFLSSLYRTVKLEYLMLRNSTQGVLVLELEDHILNGRPYWNTVEKQANLKKGSDGASTSERVIQQIISRRKARTSLKEDLGMLSHRLEGMNQWLSKTNASTAELNNGKFERLIEYLNLRHAITYRRFIVGIDSIIDTYLDKDANQSSNPNELLEKSLQLRDTLTRRIPAIKSYWENGFNMNQLALQSMYQDYKTRSLTDDQEHEKMQQPMLNEESLMPVELELVRSMFNKNVYYDGSTSHQALVHPYCRDYSYLDNSLLNFKDSQRQYAFTNFMAIDQRVQSYLQYKGLSPTSHSLKDCLQGELDYLTLECDSRHLSQMYCTLLNRGEAPRSSVKGYRAMLKRYKDETVLRIIEERDRMVEGQKAGKKDARQPQKKAEDAEDAGQQAPPQNDLPARKVGPGQLPPGHKVDRESMGDVLSLSDEEEMSHSRVESQHFMTQVCEKRAEIAVVKRLLEIKLMSYGAQMLQTEHSALLSFLNQAATDGALQLYIPQDQQFAANLSLGSKESAGQPARQYMDLSNKLSSVQQFLTRLRNRCSEVETLTSGTGIVFSLKDFNECLQMMCRNLVKASEEELRSRVETQALKENMYRHMLYLKEQQVQYYRHKCEHFLQHSDRMVSAKLMQRGSQLLYDLDLTSRELRTLKDNIHVMERMMRTEVRNEYVREIQERGDEARKYKESFGGYKDRLNKQVREEVAERIGILKQEVEIMKRRTKDKQEEMNTGSTQRSFPHNSSSQRELESHFQQNQEQSVHQDDPTRKAGYYDAEALKEINLLSRHFRRYQLFNRFKEVVTKEKHERELYNQRQRLTSNQCLWEQLGESESREALLRQELYFTAQNLATYEKIVSKLQHQLEVMQSDKMRLVQYKQTTMRQVESMEQKMREVEILENIDLQKVIDELQSRDKKLKHLTVETSQANEKIAQARALNEKKMKDVKKKLEQERDLKSQAFSQLEGMRIEIKAIEGGQNSQENVAELWKQKCKELFEICRDLQRENDDLKAAKTVTVMTKLDSTRGGGHSHVDTQLLEEAQHYYSMAPVQRDGGQGKRDGSSQKRRHGSTDYNTINGSSREPTTKPSTAGGGKRQGPRLLSKGGGVGSTRQHVQHPWSGHPTIHHNHDGTLTSGMSLPEILMGQEISDGTSPNSSSMVNHHPAMQQKSRFPQSGLANANQGIMNSGEIFTMHGQQPGYMNGSATSSDLFHLRHSQKRQSTRGSQGLQLEGTDPTLGAHPEIKQSNVPLARSSAGLVFSGLAPADSSHIVSMKAMQRGSTIGANKKSRLMTSQGPRQQRIALPADQQSTTGTMLSSQVPGILGHVPSSSNRKSLGAVGVSSTTSRGVLSGGGIGPGAGFMVHGQSQLGGKNLLHTSANLAAGLSIANASLPTGPAQVVAQRQQQQPISFNINFNTTNINMK